MISTRVDLYTRGEPDLAVLWIDAIIDDARGSAVPEIKSLGRPLKQWRTPILARHTTGASNGPTEGRNSIIKKIKRVAAGFTNFNHYRTRILLAIGGCSWTLNGAPPRCIAKSHTSTKPHAQSGGPRALRAITPDWLR